MLKSLSKKFWVSLALLSGCLFLGGALLGVGVPKLKNLILLKVVSYSHEKLPIDILPTQLSLHFFPLAVSFEQVKLLPKDELKAIIDPFEIGEVEVEVSLFRILTGDLKINRLAVRDTKVEIRLPETKKRSSEKPLEGLFENLQQIPLQYLDIERSDVRILVPNPKTKIEISDIFLNLEKYNDEIGFTLDSDSIYLKDLTSKADLRIATDTKLFFTPNKVIVSHFKIQRGDSQFVANGTANGDIEALKFKDYDLKARGDLSLESLSIWAGKALGKSYNFPRMEGSANVVAELKLRPGHSEEYSFDLKDEKLKILKYFIGEVEAKGGLSNKELTVPSLKVTNDSFTAELQNVKALLNENIQITALAKIKKFSLFELFKDLGQKQVPIWLQAKGELPCEAEVKPSFSLKCTGSIQANGLLLKPGLKTESTIVKVDSFAVSGGLQVNSDEISYDAHITMPNSKGASQGTISFQEGFKIKYSAETLSFKDVANLADLKIEGNTQVSGETSGDSNAATMSLVINGNDFWLSDFWLGSAKANLGFSQGKLNISNLYGRYPKSTYQADVLVNLSNNRISVLGRSQKLDASDLQEIFTRKVKLPFTVSGVGAIQAKVWGPLKFNALSYDLKSQITHGTLWREPFDQINFDIHARDGEVATDRVQFVRGAEAVTAAGVGHPDGNIDVSAHAQNIKLEDSPNFLDYGLNVTSLAQFDLKLQGYVLKPDADLYGTLTKTSIAETAAGDSDFHLKFRESSIEAQGNFLTDTILADLVIPLSESAPFALKVKTKDWNFAPLFTSFKGLSAKRDFDSRLSSDINLSSAKGGFWSSTGKIEIQKFELKRASLSMSAPKEIKIKANDGQFRIENLSLEGQNTSFKISDAASPSDKIDWQMNGKLDMNLISLLLPFFEELRGELSFACNLKANATHFDLLGSAYVEHGYLKLFDFVHPLDEIKADILFNKKKILINSIKADFASGQISGDGNLEFKAYKNFPFQLNATLEKVAMKVPDGFLTKGDGKITLSGIWFPFLLKGNYVVNDGLVTKEFGGGDDGPIAKANQYLPKNISEENQSPLLLDLDVDFTKGLPVRNSLMDGTVKGQMSIKGSADKPALFGTITAVPESKVKINDHPFEVIAGTFTFDNPKEINPKLYLTARTHIDPSTPNSKDIEYDVNLLVQGNASKPVVILTSQPALSQPDIISLLALGTISTNPNVATVNTTQQNGNPGFMLPSSVLKTSPIGKELKDRFNVDLQFTSGFDETDNTAVQKISVSGKLAEKLGWVYNHSLGTHTDNEVELKYNLTKRFQVVGSFVNRQADETEIQQQKIDNPNVLGLDLEYRFQFK